MYRKLSLLMLFVLSFPQTILFAQSQPRPVKPRTQQRPADTLAGLIDELLKLNPLRPGGGTKPKSGEDTSSGQEEKPPADNAPLKELVDFWLRHGSESMKPSDIVRERLLDAVEDRPRYTDRLINLLPDSPSAAERLYKLLQNAAGNEDKEWKETLHDWLKHHSRYFREELIESARSTDADPKETAASLQSWARLDWEAARPIVEALAAGNKPYLSAFAVTLLYEHASETSDWTEADRLRARLKTIIADRAVDAAARSAALSSLAKSDWEGQQEWVISLFADPTLNRRDKTGDSTKPDSPGADPVATTRNGQIESSIPPAEMEFSAEAMLWEALSSQPEKWFPTIRDLIGNANRNVHEGAVRWMLEYLPKTEDKKRKVEIAETLLPWLLDKRWAERASRHEYINNLANLKMPEAIPGLIRILETDEAGETCAAAANALKQYRDPRAVPGLRRALERAKDEESRASFITALILSGGFSDDELAAAIETNLTPTSNIQSAHKTGERVASEANAALPLDVSIGRVFSENGEIRPTEGLALKLIERARALRTKRPEIAKQLLQILKRSNVPIFEADEADLVHRIDEGWVKIVEADLVQRIGEGWVEIDWLTLALEMRDSLQKDVGDALYKLYDQGGSAAGIAAVLLADQSRQKDVLEAKDSKSQLALLASARYLRDKLPVEMVGKLIDSPDRLVAKAAENYLEVEDSREARNMILKRHPGEAYILGDQGEGNARIVALKLYFSNIGSLIRASNSAEEVSVYNLSNWKIDADQKGSRDILSAAPPNWEEVLRREVQTQAGLEEIFAIISQSRSQSLQAIVIRVRDGQAEMSLHETTGRRKVRFLTNSEFNELKSFSSRDEIEDLGPENYQESYDSSVVSLTGKVYFRIAVDEPERHEYLRLAKEGGRRIQLDQFGPTPRIEPTLHEQLAGLFYRLSHSGEFRVRYDIEESIPGVEVLFADDNQTAATVCAEGREMRVLIAEKRDESRPYKNINEIGQWRVIRGTYIGNLTEEAGACRVLFRHSVLSVANAKISRDGPEFTSRQGEAIVYSEVEPRQGVWKAAPGSDPVKLVDGNYMYPRLSPDGKWLIAIKTSFADEKEKVELVRRNLQTNEEFPVAFPQEQFAPPLEWSDAHGKMLLARLSYEGADARISDPTYLLDVNTGAIQPVKGEFRPLDRQFFRPLQPTGKPNEFWAAIADSQKRLTRIGRYDAKNFTFTPIAELPHLLVQSDDIWVDLETGKLWVTYQGHLLRIPIPAQKDK